MASLCVRFKFIIRPVGLLIVGSTDEVTDADKPVQREGVVARLRTTGRL